MITIAKTWTFDAAHALDRLPPSHKCHRMHGHTYRVEVRLTGCEDINGILVDYDELDKVWAPIADQVDHRVLNEVPHLGHPTTERLAVWLYAQLSAGLADHLDNLERRRIERISVRVYESSSTWAEYG